MRGFECVIHQLIVQILHMTDGVICTGFAAAILTKRVTSEQWTEIDLQVTYLQPDFS